MQKDELTAILAALLIARTQPDYTPQQAIDTAEEIQRTFEAHNRAAGAAARIASIANLDAAQANTRALLRKLNPDS